MIVAESVVTMGEGLGRGLTIKKWRKHEDDGNVYLDGGSYATVHTDSEKTRTSIVKRVT